MSVSSQADTEPADLEREREGLATDGESEHAELAAIYERRGLDAMLAEVMGDEFAALRALISEYLFVSIFRACAESLASENASRLTATQRAETNIDELLEGLTHSFHRLRQAEIDEELFDLVSGYEALAVGPSPKKRQVKNPR